MDNNIIRILDDGYVYISMEFHYLQKKKSADNWVNITFRKKMFVIGPVSITSVVLELVGV